MPETQDWAAAPQTGVQVATQDLVAGESLQTQLLGISQAGQRIVLVDVVLSPITVYLGESVLRGMLEVGLAESGGSPTLGTLVISPESPVAHLSPPFGALQLAAGVDLELDYASEAGAGAQAFWATVYYYRVGA